MKCGKFPETRFCAIPEADSTTKGLACWLLTDCLVAGCWLAGRLVGWLPGLRWLLGKLAGCGLNVEWASGISQPSRNPTRGSTLMFQYSFESGQASWRASLHAGWVLAFARNMLRYEKKFDDNLENLRLSRSCSCDNFWCSILVRALYTQM